MLARLGAWLAQKLTMRALSEILALLINWAKSWKRTKKDAENEKKYKDAIKENKDEKEVSKAAEDFLNGN